MSSPEVPNGAEGRGPLAALLLLPVLVTAVWFLSFGSSGWHSTDYELTFSYFWRVANGEVPYRDFIYHKPPLTPYLHAFWVLLPDAWQVRASRAFFYLELSAAGLLPVLWAVRRGGARASWRLPFLALAFTLFALHNFPPIPWYTVDALLCTAIALVAFLESLTGRLERRLVMRAVASLFLALALLAKQTFFVPAALFGVWAVAELVSRRTERGRKLATFAASALPAAGALGLTAAALALAGAFPDFLAQMRSQSTGANLFHHGLEPLLKPDAVSLAALLIGLALPFGRRLDEDGSRRGFALPRALAVAAFLLLGWCAFDAQELSWAVQARLGYAFLWLLVGTLLGRLVLARRNPARRDTALDVLGWGIVAAQLATAISLGYQSPILAVAAGCVVLHEALPRERRPLLDLAPAVLLAALVGVQMWRLNWTQPYRDLPRPMLRSDLGTLYPKLSGIRTNEMTFAQYADLKNLLAKHAAGGRRPFFVASDFAGIHWLTGTRTPASIDWDYGPDAAGFETRIWNELVSSGAVLFVPKQGSEGLSIPLVKMVLARCPLLEETGFFFVLAPAKGPPP